MDDERLERRKKVWRFLERGLKLDLMAKLLRVHRSTIKKDVKMLQRRLAKPKLAKGDWVKVLPSAMWPSYHGKVGRVFYVTSDEWPAKDQECMVNFEPWNDKAPDTAFQGFMSSHVRRLSDMEVIAEMAQ